MKYKLIKNFPESGLELGDIIDFSESSRIRLSADTWSYEYNLENVVKYPEFFELVEEEKLYEILEFRQIGVGTIFKKTSENKYSSIGEGFGSKLEDILKYD